MFFQHFCALLLVIRVSLDYDKKKLKSQRMQIFFWNLHYRGTAKENREVGNWDFPVLFFSAAGEL